MGREKGGHKSLLFLVSRKCIRTVEVRSSGALKKFRHFKVASIRIYGSALVHDIKNIFISIFDLCALWPENLDVINGIKTIQFKPVQLVFSPVKVPPLQQLLDGLKLHEVLSTFCRQNLANRLLHWSRCGIGFRIGQFKRCYRLEARNTELEKELRTYSQRLERRSMRSCFSWLTPKLRSLKYIQKTSKEQGLQFRLSKRCRT